MIASGKNARKFRSFGLQKKKNRRRPLHGQNLFDFKTRTSSAIPEELGGQISHLRLYPQSCFIGLGMSVYSL